MKKLQRIIRMHFGSLRTNVYVYVYVCVYGVYACVCVCVCVCRQLSITVLFDNDICYLFVFIGNSRSMSKHERLVIRQSYLASVKCQWLSLYWMITV